MKLQDKLIEILQKKTITLTWGCQAENHVGMQKVGNGLSDNGFTNENLIFVKYFLTYFYQFKLE